MYIASGGMSGIILQCLQAVSQFRFDMISEHGQKTSRRTQATKLNFAVHVQLIPSPVVSGDGPNGQRNREPKIEKLISIQQRPKDSET